MHTLSADLEGITDGRAPLVLLHGLTYDRTTWQPVLTELRRIDPARRILAVDLPGHGHSPAQSSHRMADIVATVHDAVTRAGLEAPVLVGHSISGGTAVLYAAAHPSRGVVSVDSPPEIAGFADMVRANREALHSPAFPAIWAAITAGFHLEVLSEPAQNIVRSAARPDQQLVLSYWEDLLTTSSSDLDAMVSKGIDAMSVGGVPYLLVVGSELDPAVRQRIDRDLPGATIETWAGSGHFPHLARPAAFARLLADTGSWTAAAR